jgi:hypothetical protein
VRVFMIPTLALVGFSAGCSGDSHAPTSPHPAFVRFDSLTIVSVDGQVWQAFAASNVGQSTAYRVRAYWHIPGEDLARESLLQPPNLTGGQSGLAPTMPMDNPAWTHPSAPDSIQWSEAP